jgi:hypothetical protein
MDQESDRREELRHNLLFSMAGFSRIWPDKQEKKKSGNAESRTSLARISGVKL